MKPENPFSLKLARKFIGQIDPSKVKWLLQLIAEQVDKAATFSDKHDLIVPDMSVAVGVVAVSLSFKRLEKKQDKETVH